MSKQLTDVINGLRIIDVYMRSCEMELVDGFDPLFKDPESEFDVQQMHIIKDAEVIKTNNNKLFLKVVLQLGIRWVEEEDTKDNVKAFIEAEFVSIYKMDQEYDNDLLQEFSEANPSYHVWPYWREFVSNHAERMRLPKVMLPFMKLPTNRQKTTKN